MSEHGLQKLLALQECGVSMRVVIDWDKSESWFEVSDGKDVIKLRTFISAKINADIMKDRIKKGQAR